MTNILRVKPVRVIMIVLAALAIAAGVDRCESWISKSSVPPVARTMAYHAPARAATKYHNQSDPIVSHTCNFTLHGAEFVSSSPEYTRTWLTNISGKCKSGYPIQYNRTGCSYPPRKGEFWRDGPARKGAGTIKSNYSGVTCNQYAHGVIVDVYGWWNVGYGWGIDHLYHL